MKSDHGFNEFIESACAALGLDVAEVKARRRGHRGLVDARKLIAYALRQRWELSYPHIAKLLGDRDHTTVMVGVKAVTRAVEAGERWAIDGVARVGGAEAR